MNTQIQAILDHKKAMPELRAYCLLKLASCYLDHDEAAANEQSETKSIDTAKWIVYEHWDRLLSPWADDVARSTQEVCFSTHSHAKVEARPNHEHFVMLADAAINEAIKQLELSTHNYIPLILYFIASRLSCTAGNFVAAKNCDDVLEKAIHTCEKDMSADRDSTDAVVSFLNAQAYGIIPLKIRDFESHEYSDSEVPPYTEEEFKECEKIKLRIVKMVEQLDKSNHLRRKTHRDLVLWYKQLGMSEQSEQQKQILFDLVGCSDDSILYAQSVGCGSLTWWRKEKLTMDIRCGMG
ncbi:MAG TPA: hypothetical protein V6C81_13660 [Planktothrix sp.]|jgi:hypothetical protein